MPIEKTIHCYHDQLLLRKKETETKDLEKVHKGKKASAEDCWNVKQ